MAFVGIMRIATPSALVDAELIVTVAVLDPFEAAVKSPKNTPTDGLTLSALWLNWFNVTVSPVEALTEE
jgi:hypothetical protein